MLLLHNCLIRIQEFQQKKKLISGFDDYNENFYMGRICSGRFRNKIEQDEREC